MRRSITVGRGRSASPATVTASAHRVVERVHPGFENVGEGIEAPADGTTVTLTVDEGDAEYQALLELAKGPLPELDDEFVPADSEERQVLATDLASTLQELAASGQLANSESVSAALAVVAQAHQQTMESVREVLVASGGSGAPDSLTLAALSVLDGFARRPAEPAPNIHVHTPKHDLNVHIDTPEVHPHFTVQAPAPADVHVEVHTPPVEVAPSQVTVHVPEPVVQAAAAPIVHVTAPETVERKPNAVRVEYDPDGAKVFVPVYEDEA